jgi:hypothetical protein
MPIQCLEARGSMKNRAFLLALLSLIFVLLFQNCNNSKETFDLLNSSSKTKSLNASGDNKVTCPISSYPEGMQNLKAFSEVSWFANFDADYTQKYIIKWFANDLGLSSEVQSDYFLTSVSDINNSQQKAGKHSRKYKLTDAFGNLVCESAEIEYNYLKACPIRLVVNKTDYLVGEKVVISIDPLALDDQQLRGAIEYWSGKKDLNVDLTLATGQIKNGRDTEFTFTQPGFYSRQVLIKEASGNYLCESQPVSFNIKAPSPLASSGGSATSGAPANPSSGAETSPSSGSSSSAGSSSTTDPQSLTEKATIQWFFRSVLTNGRVNGGTSYSNGFSGEANLTVNLFNGLNNAKPIIELTAERNDKWSQGSSNNSSVSLSTLQSSTVLTTRTFSTINLLTGTSTPQQVFASYTLKITCPSGTYLYSSCQSERRIQHSGYRPDSVIPNSGSQITIPSFTGVTLGSNPNLEGVCYCIPNGR